MHVPSNVTAVVSMVSAVAIGAVLTGCASTSGTPVAERSESVTSTTTTASSTAQSPTQSPVTPTGAPVGSAVMAVRGGAGPVTIRYRINGGTEQTETNVTLPWEKQYSVYDKLESEVSADGGDAELICTITMDGDKLVSFVTEPRPTCTFAYWG